MGWDAKVRIDTTNIQKCFKNYLKIHKGDGSERHVLKVIEK